MAGDDPQILNELVGWMRVLSRDRLREILVSTLTTENDVKVYELTDGTRTGSEVSSDAGVAKSSVSEKWKGWRPLGILVETDDPKKPRHIMRVADAGGLD